MIGCQTRLTRNAKLSTRLRSGWDCTPTDEPTLSHNTDVRLVSQKNHSLGRKQGAECTQMRVYSIGCVPGDTALGPWPQLFPEMMLGRSRLGLLLLIIVIV